jgi:MscS family membrane protein
MTKQFLFKFLFILLTPIFLLSENIEQTPVKLIKKEDVNIKEVENKNNTTLQTTIQSAIQTNDDSTNDIEKQIALQNKLLEDVITNINNESYLNETVITQEVKDQITFLTNRININKREKNDLAIKRDELKLLYYKQLKSYDNTLKQIIIAKEEYKDKKYFVKLLEDNKKLIEESNIDSYTPLYEQEKKNDNKVSNELVDNYIELYNQSNTQTFVLQYLLENMSKYRQTNFFLDEFNLQYLVSKIDSIKGISFISNLTSYHLKFSVGEIIVVMFIIVFFRLINKYLVSLLAIFIAKLFVKEDDEESEVIRQYLRMSIDTPLIYALYTLSIQISIFILIKDQNIINNIMPWINTLYIAILTWAVYSILNNSINIYAHNLLEKYPNVRKEMIVFILRIIKIILILLVILFLFSQLGVDIKAIAASLGVGGIAIALASKDTLANFFGSLNIMTDNSFSQGDWIKSGDIEGTVVDIRMRTTRIRTFDNAMITVPNSQLANTHIMNWSKRVVGRRIKMSIGLMYENKMKDIVNLKDDIHNMLKNHPEIASDESFHISKSKNFEATKREDLIGVKNTLLVFVDEFAGSSVNILVYCFSKSPVWEEWLKTKEDVLVKISELVEKNNCDFAYPTQAILIKKDEEVSTMSQEK